MTISLHPKAGLPLCFFVDDFAEFSFDGVPTHGFALGVFSAAGEEHAEGKNAARGLDVFLGDARG